MELEEIVSKVAKLIPVIDSNTKIQNRNRRNKRPYVKGVATLFEPQFTQELVAFWKKEDGDSVSWINDEHPYPDGRETCDLVLSSKEEPHELGSFEWAIEMKYLRLVGNNGNNNDYVMQKAISPFLKDRSLVHDIEKLKNATFGKRKAVIFYGFDYNSDSHNHADLICQRVIDSIGHTDYYVEAPENLDKFLNDDLIPTPNNLKRVIKSVDKYDDTYSLESVTKVIDAFLTVNNIASKGPFVSKFSDLERHPCGQFGRVVGWEI